MQDGINTLPTRAEIERKLRIAHVALTEQSMRLQAAKTRGDHPANIDEIRRLVAFWETQITRYQTHLQLM